MVRSTLRTLALLIFVVVLTFAFPLSALAACFRNGTEQPLDRNRDSPLEGASWIWFAGDPGDSAIDAPIETRFFRREFTLRAGWHFKQAWICITADNAFTLFVNGKVVGRGDDWMSPKTYDLRKYLKPGRNIVAVQATNEPAITVNDPAGLVARIKILPTNGKVISLVTDGAWQSVREAHRGWQAAGYGARTWPPARVLGAYGRKPWGRH